MRYAFQNNINAYLSKSSKLSVRLNVQLRDLREYSLVEQFHIRSSVHELRRLGRLADLSLYAEIYNRFIQTGQKKASMVGSVQAIRPAELKVPSTNLSNSFAGRLSGVVAVQRTGRPGADGSDFWIRGIS